MSAGILLRQLLAAVVGGALLGGCSATLNQSVQTPRPEAIFEYAKTFEDRTGQKVETVADYIIAGIVYVDHQCEAFFNELEVQKRELAFYNSVSNKALTGTITLLPAITSNPKKPQAVLAALAGLAGVAFEQYDHQFHFSPYSVQLRRLVLQAQSKLKSEVAPEQISRMRIFGPNGRANGLAVVATDRAALSGMLLAHNAVQQYAKTCTIPQLQLFIETALNSVNAVASVPIDRNAAAFALENFRSGGTDGSRGTSWSSPPFVAR